MGLRVSTFTPEVSLDGGTTSANINPGPWSVLTKNGYVWVAGQSTLDVISMVQRVDVLSLETEEFTMGTFSETAVGLEVDCSRNGVNVILQENT